MRITKLLLILSSSWCWAQNGLNNDAGQPSPSQVSTTVTVTVPAGTKLLLALKSAVNTKTAHPGDGVYLETTFPITSNNRIVIPAGTYVQGVIDNVKRPGKVKGRAEVLFHFNTLIFPSGYTVAVPGALQDAPGVENGMVKDKEGTMQAEGQKGRDAGTIAGPAATGTLIGGLSHGGKGAAIGGLAGAGVGLAQVLLTRGDDIRIPQGTSVEMVLQRPLQLEERRLTANSGTEFVPSDQRGRPLQKPPLTPAPEPR
jgi:hypothetical protein